MLLGAGRHGGVEAWGLGGMGAGNPGTWNPGTIPVASFGTLCSVIFPFPLFLTLTGPPDSDADRSS